MTDVETRPSKSGRRRWVWPAAFVGGLVVLVVLAGAIGFAMANRQPNGEKTFALSGVLRLSSPGTWWSKAEPCSGQKGMADLTAGTPVTITDSGGQTIGLGALKPGAAEGSSQGNDICAFAFLVPNVPTGKGFYGAEVAKRGVVQFSEEQARSGRVELSIGG